MLLNKFYSHMMGKVIWERVHLRRQMVGSMIRVAGILVILTLAISSHAQNTKKKNGLNFQVPEDWPIEKRGGIVAPIPTEEYVSIKFMATEKKFQTIKNDLTNKFEELQIDITNMEINFTKEIQKAHVHADSPSGSGEDLTDLLARINFLESEVKRIDLKITTKVAIMKIKSGEAVTLTKSYEKRVKELQSQINNLNAKVDYINEIQGSAY